MEEASKLPSAVEDILSPVPDSCLDRVTDCRLFVFDFGRVVLRGLLGRERMGRGRRDDSFGFGEG